MSEPSSISHTRFSKIQTAIARREMSCFETVRRCIERIDAYESQIRAWVVVDRERALARARELDSAPQIVGALHGIPVGIKDIVDVAGLPTTAGSGRSDGNAARDAPVVEQLKRAGAIILGKTVTTQFACFDPPETRNPWNTDHTPGGSSSGSAAAVATGMCLAAVGSQTGGSVIRPASFCGISSIKPTFGWLNMGGVFPVAPSLDHLGFMAGDVAGLIAMMSACGMTPAEPVEYPPTIACPGGIFQSKVDAEMKDAFESTIGQFRNRGAKITNARVPADDENVIREHRKIMCFETWQTHEQRFQMFPDDYLPGITSLLQEGQAITADEYAAARTFQTQRQQEMDVWFEQNPGCILATPATPGSAPAADSTGNPVMNSPWSFTGLPSISIPCGMNKAGLPLAIQLIGPRNSEQSLLASAMWCEQSISRDETASE